MQQRSHPPIKAFPPLILCVFLALAGCSVIFPADIPRNDGRQNTPALTLTVPALPEDTDTPGQTPPATATDRFPGPTSTSQLQETVTQTYLDEPTPTQMAIVSVTPPGPVILPEEHRAASGLYVFSPLIFYMVIEQMENTLNEPIIIDGFEPTSDSDGPAQGYDLSFANYANLIAYWPLGVPGKLFISDLSSQTQHLIFTDTDQAYRIGDGERVRLIWSPDDLHLIVDIKDSVERDFIYHLQTGVREPWPYDCDRVAWSPKSEKMATWCMSLVEPTQFAVLEWGGELWYSPESPARELVRRKTPPVRFGLDEKPLTWGWSSDGEKIAFYDPEDPLGHLHLANAEGEIQISIPGKAYWLVTDDPATLPPYNPIRWSFHENRILLYGAGEDPLACPPWRNIFDEPPVAKPVPCWQVIDASSGETIWTVSDSLEGIFYGADVSVAQNFTFLNANLSPDGKYLALFSYVSGAKNLHIIDLDSHKVLRGWDFDAQTMRWSNSP